MPELEALRAQMVRKDFEDKRFAAALKGHKMDDPYEEEESTYKKMQQRVKERLAGGAEKQEARELGSLGIKFIQE